MVPLYQILLEEAGCCLFARGLPMQGAKKAYPRGSILDDLRKECSDVKQPEMRYFLGLDLGMAGDFTAFAVVKRPEVGPRVPPPCAGQCIACATCTAFRRPHLTAKSAQIRCGCSTREHDQATAQKSIR